MDASASENKNKYAAVGLTILFHVLLFLIFLIRINVPDPPFPIVEVPEAFVDLTGMVGTGSTSVGGSGENDDDLTTKQVEAVKPTPVVSNTAEEVITDNTGEVVEIKTSPKKKPKKQVVTETPKVVEEKVEEQKASDELANALARIKTRKPHSGKGDGNNKTGGSGTGTGKGVGDGSGDSHGPGGDGPGGRGIDGLGGYSLKDRSLVRKPQRMTDSEEEGTVVVEIFVDETGKVIKAIPGKRGSTTTSANLYAKARQAALQAKFNSSTNKEQRGTYTFVFTLE